MLLSLLWNFGVGHEGTCKLTGRAGGAWLHRPYKWKLIQVNGIHTRNSSCEVAAIPVRWQNCMIVMLKEGVLCQ